MSVQEGDTVGHKVVGQHLAQQTQLKIPKIPTVSEVPEIPHVYTVKGYTS